MKIPETTADLQHTLGKEMSSKRALLIDRYPNARTSLRMMLSAMGVGLIDNAGTSADVFRQLRAHRFDIILSDYLLEDGARQPATARRAARATTPATVYRIHRDHQ
jgi:DNA-binding NarL/FixJ family response regulator